MRKQGQIASKTKILKAMQNMGLNGGVNALANLIMENGGGDSPMMDTARKALNFGRLEHSSLLLIAGALGVSVSEIVDVPEQAKKEKPELTSPQSEPTSPTENVNYHSSQNLSHSTIQGGLNISYTKD